MQYEKAHINIGTIGHLEHGKMSLTDAINISLAERGMNKFVGNVNCDILLGDEERDVTINEAYLKSRESSKTKKKKR